MDCTKADELIVLYPAGDMPGALRRHLQECHRCRSEHEDSLELIARLRSAESPVPTDEFWGRLRADVRQGIEDSEKAEAISVKEGLRFTLIKSPLWQRALVPAMLVIVFVAAYVHYMPGYELPENIDSPVLEELAEAGVEIYIEMDEDEVTITSMIMETGELSGSIYYELYGMENEELANFYDSLGLMMESM